MKRLLFFIAVFMTVALNAQTPWNGTTEMWTKGDGTIEDPFQIETAEQFAHIAVAHEEGNIMIIDNFKLMNNLDMGGAPSQSPRQEWTPIGNFDKPFRAKFNGNGKTISNLYVNIEGPYAGIFGLTLYTDISNLGLIGESNISGGYFVGGIVGYLNNSSISNCYSMANVNGVNVDPGNVGGNVGGITGRSGGNISNCCNTGNISGVANFVGGITGYNLGTMTNAYNTGNISGALAFVGGVAGYSTNKIMNCYNVGGVAITGKEFTVGGLVGKSSGTVTNCYKLTGKVSLNGVAGDGSAFGDVKTEAEMKADIFVASLNAEQAPAIWFADSGNVNSGYPILKYQIQYVITVTAGDNGTVIGGGTYTNGSQATLTAIPNANYTFVKWNDGNIETTRVITVIADATYKAEFAPIKYTLIVTAGENGTVSGGGEYNYNTEATLTATADADYIFNQWSDGNTENPRKVIVTADATYTAEFAEYKGVNSTEDMGLMIYPNPMTDFLRIEGECTSIELYNSSGKLVFSTDDASTIDVSSFSHGAYILKAYNNDKVGTYKVIK